MRAAGICLYMLAAGAAPAGEQTFVLQAHVDRGWTRELVRIGRGTISLSPGGRGPG